MKRAAAGLIAALLLAAVAFVAALNSPVLLFPFHATLGRLSLWSDRPFSPVLATAVLADVEARLQTSPLDDRKSHGVCITNASWRRMLFFNVAGGAAGVNYYPLSNNVFIRQADIDRDRVIGASGKPAEPPRTLAYYAAHEIVHSFTAERLGPGRLWNARLPQWVREGYADYVGFGGRVDVDELYRRYQARDATLDYHRSGTYARFRMLVAYLLTGRHWSVDQLLASRLSLAQAQALVDADLASTNRR